MFSKAFKRLTKSLKTIKDPRDQNKITHTFVSLIFYGLLIFLFKFCSRKDINKELGKFNFRKNLNIILPELGKNPHSDTVARLMERIDPEEIEKRNVELIKKLIEDKKFVECLIEECLPFSIDGVQKTVRNTLQSVEWLQRTIQTKEGRKVQKYVAILECNITLKNGMTIPVMSEFLSFNKGTDPKDNVKSKQDCELTGFKRICERLKKYFPRLKILLMFDKLYATLNVISAIEQNNWKYGIVLPIKKCSKIHEFLNAEKDNKKHIEDQKYYNKREQMWYFKNNIEWNKKIINAVACFEKYEKVNSHTGEIETKYSEHKWITNFEIKMNNIHEICNLGFRKRWGIEDSNNTEKNRGYNYKHLFSTKWNAMKCFHYLMRLSHALNAILEFNKKLKKLMVEYGISYVLNLNKETLMTPFIDANWYYDLMYELNTT